MVSVIWILALCENIHVHIRVCFKVQYHIYNFCTCVRIHETLHVYDVIGCEKRDEFVQNVKF